MERVVRQKNYQLNHQSLALTGRFAIDDHAAVHQAAITAQGSPHKTLIIPLEINRSGSPKEFKKT